MIKDKIFFFFILVLTDDEEVTDIEEVTDETVSDDAGQVSQNTEKV